MGKGTRVSDDTHVEELNYKKLLEASSAPILFLDIEFNIVAVTDAYLEITYTKRDEILGRYVFDVFPPNPAETGFLNLNNSFSKVIENKMTDIMDIIKYDIRKHSDDNVLEEHYWVTINSPIFDSHGKVKYIANRVENVTDYVLQQKINDKNKLAAIRTKIEKEIDAALKEKTSAEMFLKTKRKIEQEKILKNNQKEFIEKLKVSNKELEMYAHTVAHDIKAPLRSIKAFCQILENEHAAEFTDKAAEYLRYIIEGVNELNGLVEALLVLSNFSKIELKKHQIDMNNLVETIIKEESNGKKITFSIETLPHCTGDRHLIKQVLHNLVSNAVKFSRNNHKPKIHIGALLEKEGVIYYIKDNGVGFNMKYESQIYNVFKRLHKTDEFEGTGLGLAIVDTILKRHHGKIWAQSELGKGATFYFTIGE